MSAVLSRVSAKDFRNFALVVSGSVLFVLLALWGKYLLFSLDGTYAVNCDDYALSTMLVTYELGWLPRGLLGTLLLPFGYENSIQAAGLFTNVLVFAFICAYIVIFVHFWRHDRAHVSVPALLLVWPGLVVLGFGVSQPRADILMYWLFCLCLFVLTFRSSLLVPVTVVIGTIAILVHEGWVFLFLPFLLFLIWTVVGFRQAVITGVLLLVPFLFVELCPHVGMDEVVSYVRNRKQLAGWYDISGDSLSLWANNWSETESMAYFQYGDTLSLTNLINVFEHARSFHNVFWLFGFGLNFFLLSIPQLLICGYVMGEKLGIRLLICVLPFLLIMLGTQLDWVRFVPMYTFGFGTSVFVLWLKGVVAWPFVESDLERVAG